MITGDESSVCIKIYTGALSTRVQATQGTFLLLCKIDAFTAGVITGDERGVNRVFCNYIILGA